MGFCMHIPGVKCSNCMDMGANIQFPIWPQIQSLYEPKEHCKDHCFCQEIEIQNPKNLKMILHKQCCMCQQRKVVGVSTKDSGIKEDVTEKGEE